MNTDKFCQIFSSFFISITRKHPDGSMRQIYRCTVILYKFIW